MLRTVRIAERLVELAGLQQVWLGVDHLCNSRITLYYPKSPVQTIEYGYGKWAQAEKDKKIIEEAVNHFLISLPNEMRTIPKIG